MSDDCHWQSREGCFTTVLWFSEAKPTFRVDLNGFPVCMVFRSLRSGLTLVTIAIGNLAKVVSQPFWFSKACVQRTLNDVALEATFYV